MEQAYLKVKFDFDMADAKKQFDGLVGKINKNNNVAKTIDNNTKQFINVVKNYERVEKARSRNLLLEERINKRKDDNVFKSLQAIDRQEKMRLKEDKILMDMGFKESKERQRKEEASEKMRLKEDKILMDIEYKREIETKKDERYMLREKEKKERLMVKEREKSELKLLKIRKEDEKKSVALAKQQAKEEERARKLSDKEKSDAAKQEKAAKGQEMAFRLSFVHTMLSILSKVSEVAKEIVEKTEGHFKSGIEMASRRQTFAAISGTENGLGSYTASEFLSRLPGLAEHGIRNETSFFGRLGNLYDEAVKNKDDKNYNGILKNYTHYSKDVAMVQVFKQLSSDYKKNPKRTINHLKEIFGPQYYDSALEIVTKLDADQMVGDIINANGGSYGRAESVFTRANENSTLIRKAGVKNQIYLGGRHNQLLGNNKATSAYIADQESKTVQQMNEISPALYITAMATRDALSILDIQANISKGIQAGITGIADDVASMKNSMITTQEEVRGNRRGYRD
jgi:hypothetical protein